MGSRELSRGFCLNAAAWTVSETVEGPFSKGIKATTLTRDKNVETRNPREESGSADAQQVTECRPCIEALSEVEGWQTSKSNYWEGGDTEKGDDTNKVPEPRNGTSNVETRRLLLCLPALHDSLALLGLRMMALPADFSASMSVSAGARCRAGKLLTGLPTRSRCLPVRSETPLFTSSSAHVRELNEGRGRGDAVRRSGSMGDLEDFHPLEDSAMYVVCLFLILNDV